MKREVISPRPCRRLRDLACQRCIDDQTCAEWLCRIGHTYRVKGEYDQALTYRQRCLETCVGAADPSHIADAHYDMGYAYLRMNLTGRGGATTFLQCRQIAESRLDHHQQAKATLGLGAVAADQSKLAEAKQYYEQSRRGFYQSEDRVREAKALQQPGAGRVDQGAIERGIGALPTSNEDLAGNRGMWKHCASSSTTWDIHTCGQVTTTRLPKHIRN